MSFSGRLAYHFFHRPLARVRQCKAEGGFWQEHLTEMGRRRMEQAAWNLIPPAFPQDRSSALHFLSGRRYWYQTLFCMVSWAQSTGKIPAIVVNDDGSLTSRQIMQIRNIFPTLSLVSAEETTARLDQYLSFSRFPNLRERRLHYPHLRKLTDIHAKPDGWKLVLDSDLLFFRKPDFLLNWMVHPRRPLHAVDCQESYGYPRAILEKICGQKLPALLNVGLCGLNGSSIDWEKLEYWTGKLVSGHGTSYYLEQALVAMLVAGTSCAVTPSEEYITFPEAEEALAPRATMHHYVAGSKRWYFRNRWKQFAGISPS